MTEDKLIERLAGDLTPVDPRAARRRLILCLAAGLAASALAFLFVLGLNVRPDIAEASRTAPFWIKLGVMLAALGLAWPMVRRLAAPGRDAGRWPYILLGAAGLLAVLGLVQLLLAPPETRMDLWLGHSWTRCPPRILALAIPLLAALLFAMRGLAPTRLRFAGLAAGLAAGAAAAALYSFSCTESGLPFLATWYAGGVALTGLAGLILGPRVLRW